ncbi:DNA cytosine methyltransferase [Pirellulaceae bacterium SH467]
MKCLELFAGIGGFAASFPHLQIVNAVDIDVHAACVYRSNFAHPFHIAEIASLEIDWFAAQGADCWWMSPPCTPFTRRGNNAGLSDPRCAALKHLIDVVCELTPQLVCIENVVGFESSDAFDLLRRRWTKAGYLIDWTHFCPSELGWPNLRPRFYAIASYSHRERICRRSRDVVKRKLSDYLEDSLGPAAHCESGLWIANQMAQQYDRAIDKVDPADSDAVAACFTAAYGRSIIKSGSYIRTEHGLRRFTPREVARLLGFDESFQLPAELRHRKLWHLLGNSISVPSLRAVFQDCFDLPSLL